MHWLRVCLCSGWCLVAVAAADGAVVRLRTPCSAAGAMVCLRDVADIEESDPQLLARMQGVTLCPAPAVGRSVRMDFEQIRGRLLSQGFSLTDVEFSGTSLVVVEGAEPRPEKPVSAPDAGARMSDAVRKRVLANLSRAVVQSIKTRAPELGAITVTPQVDTEQWSILAGASSAAFEVTGGAMRIGPQAYLVRFSDLRGKVQELTLKCEVARMPNVLVARRAIQRGETIEAGDVTWQALEIEPGDIPVTQIEALIGQAAQKTMRVGEPFLTGTVKPLPLVKRGDMVTVFSRTPGVTVRMEAKAQTDGALGDEIHLVSLDRRQQITARVTGYHAACLDRRPASRAAAPAGTGVQIVEESGAAPEREAGLRPSSVDRGARP